MKSIVSAQPSSWHRKRGFHHVAWGLAVVLAAVWPGSEAADGPIIAMQDALRRENLFMGERTGVLDAETQSALRRFQVQRGLPATGQVDAATLQALQRSVDTTQPTVRSLPSAAAVAALNPEIVVQDKEFLQKLEESEAAREQAQEQANSALPSVAEASPEQAREDAPSEPEGNADRPGERRSGKRTKEGRSTADRSSASGSGPAEPRVRVVEVEDEGAPLEPNGVRIVRPARSAPESRTSPSKRTAKSAAPKKPIVVRRALPVEPPRKQGFLTRLFNND